MTNKLTIRFGDQVSIECKGKSFSCARQEFCNRTISTFLEKNRIGGRWICSNSEQNSQTWINIDSADAIISAKRVDEKIKPR